MTPIERIEQLDKMLHEMNSLGARALGYLRALYVNGAIHSNDTVLASIAQLLKEDDELTAAHHTEAAIMKAQELIT